MGKWSDYPVYWVRIDDLETGWIISVYSTMWGASNPVTHHGYVIMEEKLELNGQEYEWPWTAEWGKDKEGVRRC